MKKLNLLISILTLSILTSVSNAFIAQCVNGSSWGSATASTSNGTTVTISTCNYQTEYSPLYSISNGSTYTVTNSCGGWITIYSGSNGGTLVAQGNSPLTFTPSSSGTFYANYNTNSGCGTATGCCTTTLTTNNYVPPPPPPGCGSNPAAGNTCATATPICDLNGYCGSTAGTYTANYWAQLNSGFSGSIENNSFISFVASSSTMCFDLNVSNCSSSYGIQLYLFSATGCSGNVTEYIDYNPALIENTTLCANGLTAGQTYYIMVDGNGGAVCDYQITANTGVSIPVDAGADVSICLGESTTLTATGGDGTYSWTPTGTLNTGSGATVTATPTTTTTYTVTSSTGNPLCPNSTTDDVTVTVNSGGDLDMSGSSALSGNVGPAASISVDICAGGSASLDASGASGGPSAYTWTPSTGLSCTNCANPTASPATTTTYTVTGTNSSGCDLIGYVTVNVSPAPTVTVNSGTICEGDNITLTASGMSTYTWSPSTGLSGTSGASVTASPTTTTVYTVTGSTTGCPNDTETSTVTVTPLPNPNFSIAGSQCLSTNSLTLTNTGTAGTYAWSMPSGTPTTATGSPASVSYSAAGTYNITLTTTVSGCTDDITIPVTINPDPTVTVTPTDVSCNGDCDGSITAVGAGTSGYNYNWGGAGTGATLTNLCTGPYNVTVTDINGCQVTGSGTINEPPVLGITASATDVSCAGLTDGTVTANNATGGTTPYSYSWSGGLGTNQNVTGVAAGSYTVTVTDGEGCTETATVTITEPTAITVTATSTDASCGGSDGTLTVTGTSGGSGTYVSTVWTDASSNPVADPNAVAAGSYTVTVTDNQGCTGTATVSVGNLAGPVVSLASQTNASCSMVDDGTASVSVTGGAGSPTYSWAPAPGSGQGTTSISGLVGGTTYTVTVDDAGCTDVLSVTIGTDPDPTAATVLDSDVLCPGDCNGQATATMTGGTATYTYAWGNGETTQQATALCVGSTTVTITDSDGCTADASVTVSAPNPLTVSIVGTDASCNGGTDGSADVTIADGTPPYTTVWTHGPTSEDLTGVLAAGTYTINVTDFNGCTISESVTIGEPTAITITPSATDALCNGASDGEVDASATGGTGALSYEWFSGATSVGTTSNVTGLPIGTYDIVVTDANSCTETTSVTISEPTAITLTPSSVNSNCGQADGEVSVVAAGGTVTTGYTYLWEDATPATAGTTASVTGLLAGTYTVTVTDNNGCIETATASITDAGAPTLSETHINTNCNGSFDGSIDITTTGGSTPFTYSWAGPNGYTSTMQDINLLEAGQYDVTATDNVGCVATLSVTINEPTVVTVTPSSNDASCNGSATGSVDATSGGGTGTITYEWFDDALLTNSIGTGSSQTGLAAGTYYVEATDANGCTSDASIVVGEPNAVLVTTAATDANCGLADGTVSVATVTGGSGTYVTETWVDASSNPVVDINAVPSGSYTVTVTDDQGCTGTAVQGVNDLVGPTLNLISAASASCNGYCDGTATIQAVGGTPTYVYTWNPAPGTGQGTPSVTGLCAGNYNVSVSDDNGCTDNIVVTILEPTPLVASITGNTDVTINGAADGTATASAAGGTPAYTFEWFNGCPPATTIGQTSAGATGLAAGDYAVIVQDSKGCLDTVCTTISEPTTLTIVEAITDVTCFNGTDGEISIVVSGGVPGYTYEWYDASNNTIGQTGITASGLSAGDYYVIVTDQNGATQQSANYTVAEPTQLVLTTSVTSNYNGEDISCFGSCDGAADVSVAGGTTPYTYAWDATAGSQTTAAINGLCAGTYTVDVLDGNNCPSSQTVTITEPTQLANTPSQVDASCYGVCDGEAITTASGGTAPYTYQWNDPALSTTSSITGLCAGTYDVTITDANGCSIIESYTITEPSELILGASTNGSNCNQDDGDATVSIVSGDAPFTYQWDANAGSQTTATASTLFAGSYNVVVTDANGCTNDTTISVQDLGAPTVTILTQTDVSCNGGNDGFAQIQVTDGIAPYTYSWEDCSGNPIGQTTASALNLTAGCYNGTMVDNVGCQASVSVTINEPTALNAAITASSDVTCFGYTDGSATVTAGGGTAPYTYLWNDGANQTTATATNLAPGTYQVTVTDNLGCTINASVTINEPAEIQLSTSVVDAFCSTGTGSATVAVTSAGVSPFTYNWTPTSQTTDVATNLTPGTYDVTVTDNDGCIQTAQATVGDIPPGTATIGTINDVSCNAGSDGTIDVSMSGTGTAPYTYQWYNATTGTSITGQTAIQATGLPAGDYYVEVTDANGCLSTSNTGTIAEPTAVQVNVVVTDALCFASCDGTAEAVTVGGTQPYSYTWDDVLNQTSITASGLCAGSYNVIVTDDNGCTGTASGTIAQPTAITIDSTVTNANCQQADGTACVTPSGGTGAFTYLWPDGSTNSCAANLIASTYVVTVTDANNCQEQISVEVSDLGGPVADITAFTYVSCNGLTDGQATVDMTAGNGTSFTVLWDANAGSQTTPTASNLGAGTYGVTITDDLGCNASTSVTITEPDVLAYNINTNDASCFSYCDGDADITIIGGTTPYSINWLDATNNSLSTNSSVNGLCSGNYGINVSDANGCTFTDNITINQPMQVTGIVNGTNVQCFNACDGEAEAFGDVGNAPFTFQWDAATGNQTGSLASGLCPGTYTVTITDDDGCVGTETITLTEPTELITSIDQTGNISCNGFCDGFIQGSAVGGTTPYNYTWSSNVSSTSLATNLCAGSYTMTVTDANGCVTSSSATLTEPTALSASTSATDLSCYQSCDGSANVSVSGGTAPYQYQWDNSTFATTAAFSNECAGTYTVQITDDNGCQLSETVTISQPTDINISANMTNSNCGQDNGQICANVNGGTAPYSYQWNDPNTQTGACALNLFAGCYTFTITDGNACVKDTLLCINDIAGPTVTPVLAVDVTCFGAGNGSVQFTSSGGSGTLTNEIVDGSGTTVLTGSTTAANLDGDCYTLITTDAAGCVASDVLCVAEPNALNAAVIQSTDVTCNTYCDGTALAAANGGVTPYSYSWNSGAAPTQNSNSGLCAGTFTVTITDANNCSAQANVTITEPDALSIVESITDVTCFSGTDGDISVNVTGGTPFYIYSWTNSPSTSSLAPSLSAGSYTLDLTDANGCTASETYVIAEPTQIAPVFDIFIDPTCELCNGEATVSATGGTGAYSYSWSSGNNQTAASNSGMCPGLQEVMVTDANGCSMTINQSMNNQASPQIDSITYTAPLCNGLTNGTATVYPSGIFDSNQMTYTWDAATNNQQTQTAVALGDGIYCVTVTDPNGCTASNCVDVIEPAPLSAVPDGSTTICYGEDTQIWASGQGGTFPYTIQWTPAGFTGQGPILVAPTVTTDYCFTVEDANGCLSSQECISIIVREPLALTMSPSISICDGDDVDISALASGGVPADYTFTWQDELNNAVTATTINDLSTANVSPTGAMWYYVTLSDGCSIDAYDSTQVSINPLPVAFLSAVDSSGCEPFNAQFIANSDIGVTYEYDIDCDGTNEYSGSNANFNYTFMDEGTYDVCLNVISAEGCSTQVSNVDFIEVYPLPVANFIPDPAATTILTPEITFVDNSTGANTYDWDFGDGFLMTGNPQTVYNGEENTYGSIVLPTHTFNDTGYYDVTLVVTTSYGCTDTYTETIFIESDYAFYTPNAFSPNGDGDNDTFRPIGIGIDEDNYEFYIFNRWGQLIYEGYDPYDEWDGTYMNVMSQQDVYVWKVRTRDNNGEVKEYIGHVTLVK